VKKTTENTKNTTELNKSFQQKWQTTQNTWRKHFKNDSRKPHKNKPNNSRGSLGEATPTFLKRLKSMFGFCACVFSKCFCFVISPGFLVGGFNPFEKYESKWESSPSRGENKKCLKPPPSFVD